MKTLNEIKVILERTHLPVAYHHFAEGESPGPPFIVFLSPGSHNFSADGIVYQKIDRLDVELYTDQKNPVAEQTLESALDSAGLFYDKEETYIDSEKLYEVLYEMEV